MTNTQAVTVIFPDMRIHAAGCKDIAKDMGRRVQGRGRYQADYFETYTYASLTEIAADVWADQIRESDSTPESYVAYLDLAPCVRLH